MNIWRGTDLAADILDSVKDAPGDRVAQVIVKSTDEPYYKGICADAKSVESKSLPQKNWFATVLIRPYR